MINSSDQLAYELADLRRQIEALSRGSQLSRSSLVVDGEVVTIPGTVRSVKIAKNNATVALDTANGKNSVTYSVDEPGEDGTAPGDIWFRRDVEKNTIIGVWEWTGSAWDSTSFGDEVLDSLTVGKLVSGEISAGVRIIAGPAAGTHAEMSSAGFRAYRLDPTDGSVDEVVRIGTDTDDTIGLVGSDGKLRAGIDVGGVGNFTNLSVNGDPRIGGNLLSGLFNEKAEVEAWTFNWGDPGATATEIGMVELSCRTKPNHAYAIWAGGMVPKVNGVNGSDVSFRARMTLDGTAPTITSPTVASDTVRSPLEAAPWQTPPAKLFGLHRETNSTPRTMRVGLTLANGYNGATSTSLFTDNNFSPRYFMLVDLGIAPGDSGQVNRMGGTLVGNTPPPAPPPAAKMDGESVFEASWVRNFRGNGSAVEFAEAYQGYDQGYGNGNMKSMIGFPDMTAALAGASIRYCKVWLWFGHWWNGGGGRPVLGTHFTLNPPGAYEFVHNNSFWGPTVGRAAGVWIDCSIQWGIDAALGNVRGLTLGPGPNNDGLWYGRANGAGQPNAPKIAVGWTK